MYGTPLKKSIDLIINLKQYIDLINLITDLNPDGFKAISAWLSEFPKWISRY